MSAEKDRLIRSALSDYDKEFDRICLKYKYHPILDDGLLDTRQWLKSFVNCLRFSNDMGDPTEREQYLRWQNVYRLIQDSKPNLEFIRDEIAIEGEEMKGTGETRGDAKWVEYGVALLHLADSIMD